MCRTAHARDWQDIHEASLAPQASLAPLSSTDKKNIEIDAYLRIIGT